MHNYNSNSDADFSGAIDLWQKFNCNVAKYREGNRVTVRYRTLKFPVWELPRIKEPTRKSAGMGMSDGDADSALSAALEFELKPTLDEMILQVSDDLWTVYGGQRARLIGGMIQQPMAQQVRRIAIYTALRAFLERVKYQPADVAKRLTRKGAADAEA